MVLYRVNLHSCSVSNNYFLLGSNNAFIVNENLAYGPQEKIESEAYKQSDKMVHFSVFRHYLDAGKIFVKTSTRPMAPL